MSKFLEGTEIDKIRKFISDNYNNPDMSLDMVARHFIVSPETIMSRFKASGTTFHKYVVELRMIVARQLLVDNTTFTTAYRVGEQVGYNDYNTFCKTFVKDTGMTPTQYRNSVLNIRGRYERHESE